MWGGGGGGRGEGRGWIEGFHVQAKLMLKMKNIVTLSRNTTNEMTCRNFLPCGLFKDNLIEESSTIICTVANHWSSKPQLCNY